MSTHFNTQVFTEVTVPANWANFDTTAQAIDQRQPGQTTQDLLVCDIPQGMKSSRSGIKTSPRKARKSKASPSNTATNSEIKRPNKKFKRNVSRALQDDVDGPFVDASRKLRSRINHGIDKHDIKHASLHDEDARPVKAPTYLPEFVQSWTTPSLM
jgi:hypothetical protein